MSIVLSDSGTSYQHAVKHIQAKLTDYSFTGVIKVLTLEELDLINEQDLIVALGKDAAEIASKHYPHNRQIYSYIDQHSLPKNNADDWQAVLIDQPLQGMIDLASTIVRGRFKNTILVAISESNQETIESLKTIEISNDLSLKTLIVDDDMQAAKVIDKELFDAGALIAIRDEKVWSADNAKWMLYQSYKYNVPVVGYSRSFLKAGAIASSYTTSDLIAEKTAQLIDNHQEKQKINSNLYYPESLIEFNNNIARALGYAVPEKFKGKQHVPD